MDIRQRKQRFGDFLIRAKQDPGSVLTHRASAWQYIPDHTFADDTVDLFRLGIDAADCVCVDALWSIQEDATLLQVCTRKTGDPHPPGLYARLVMDEIHWLNLYAVIDTSRVTREDFENVMTQFAERGFPDAKKFHDLSETLTKV